MWQDEISREMSVEIPDGLRQGRPGRVAQVVLLRILADQKRQADVRKEIQQLLMPQRRALRSRWQIT